MITKSEEIESVDGQVDQLGSIKFTVFSGRANQITLFSVHINCVVCVMSLTISMAIKFGI